MLDKKKRLNTYINDFKTSINAIIKNCENSCDSLIFINSNTVYSRDIIIASLKKSGISMTIPTSKEIDSFETLGGFLRSNKINASKSHTVLLLDYTVQLSEYSHNVDEIVYAINTNRDLFSQFYNNTIIISPPSLTHSIIKDARDFWSCVGLYFDTTKWYCIPCILPIVTIRLMPDYSSKLIRQYNKDKDTFNDYSKMKNSMMSEDIYSSELFNYYYKKIESYSDGILRYDLLNTFFTKITTLQIRETHRDVFLKDLSNYLYKTNTNLETIDVKIMVAEFLYKYNDVERSLQLYQSIYQFLENEWEDPKKQLVTSFIACNILMCKYVIKNVHEPYVLLSEIKDRLKLKAENEYVERELVDNYIFLISCTVQHHTYYQHKEIYEELINTSIEAHYQYISYTESLLTLLIWELFAFKGSIISENSVASVSIKIHSLLQKMVNLFCKGNYNEARNAYKHARRLAINYGHIQLKEIMELINNNIIELYNIHQNI